MSRTRRALFDEVSAQLAKGKSDEMAMGNEAMRLSGETASAIMHLSAVNDVLRYWERIGSRNALVRASVVDQDVRLTPKIWRTLNATLFGFSAARDSYMDRINSTRPTGDLLDSKAYGYHFGLEQHHGHWADDVHSVLRAPIAGILSRAAGVMIRQMRDRPVTLEFVQRWSAQVLSEFEWVLRIGAAERNKAETLLNIHHAFTQDQISKGRADELISALDDIEVGTHGTFVERRLSQRLSGGAYCRDQAFSGFTVAHDFCSRTGFTNDIRPLNSQSEVQRYLDARNPLPMYELMCAITPAWPYITFSQDELHELVQSTQVHPKGYVQKQILFDHLARVLPTRPSQDHGLGLGI